MASHFSDKKILIALRDDAVMQMLTGVCTLLRFQAIHDIQNGDDAFDLFCRYNQDIIITDAQTGPRLIDAIRKSGDKSKNPLVPIVLTCGQDDIDKAEDFRDMGVTDILRSPFTVDDIRTRFAYIFEHLPAHKEPKKPEKSLPKAKPIDGIQSAEEEDALLKSLLGHYIQHQETVLKKLRFAQDATMKSIQEVRSVGDDLKSRDNTNLHEFSRFEKMWEEIISLFLRGGVAEDDIFKIEDLITNIPKDIKQHYNQLTQQDKSFLTLLQAMNHDAYRRARDTAVKVQDAPNPMTGMTRDDYRAAIPADAEPTIAEASFVFKPSRTL
ncbi:MAG: hypothetical protein ACRBCT_05945 [Alphaproteobacteria bacterium]